MEEHKCNKCLKSFLNKKTLKKHLNNLNSCLRNKEPKLNCVFCEKIFINKYTRIRHETTSCSVKNENDRIKLLEEKLLKLEQIIKNGMNSITENTIPPTTIQNINNTITNNKSALDGSTKKQKKHISSTIKKLVWNINIGEDIGKSKCMCCNSTDITQISFNCGHIIAESNGGATVVSNLKPICQNCNSSMNTKNMYEFMISLK